MTRRTARRGIAADLCHNCGRQFDGVDAPRYVVSIKKTYLDGMPEEEFYESFCSACATALTDALRVQAVPA